MKAEMPMQEKRRKFDQDFKDGAVDIVLITGDPTPDSVGVGLELCVAERVLEASGVDCATGNLEIDLDVDIGGTGVSPATGGARTVMVHDPNERPLGGCPRRPRSFGVSHVPRPPGGALRPLRP